MRKGFLIYEEMRKYFPIYEEAVSHIWLCNYSTQNFPIYEENLIFFISVPSYFGIFIKGNFRGIVRELKTVVQYTCIRDRAEGDYYLRRVPEWLSSRRNWIFVYFFGGLEWVCHSFPCVAYFVFLIDVLIRTQRAVVVSRRYQLSHPSPTISTATVASIIIKYLNNVKRKDCIS